MSLLPPKIPYSVISTHPSYTWHTFLPLFVPPKYPSVHIQKINPLLTESTTLFFISTYNLPAYPVLYYLKVFKPLTVHVMHFNPYVRPGIALSISPSRIRLLFTSPHSLVFLPTGLPLKLSCFVLSVPLSSTMIPRYLYELLYVTY